MKKHLHSHTAETTPDENGFCSVIANSGATPHLSFGPSRAAFNCFAAAEIAGRTSTSERLQTSHTFRDCFLRKAGCRSS